MTYSLPFGLKQKPVNKYFEHGVIKFNVIQGTLCYTIKEISKKGNYTLQTGVVKDKEMLDRLLSIKTISEIQTIEVVA